jgi:subfamily B ATP-binding cassette protein MsbA
MEREEATRFEGKNVEFLRKAMKVEGAKATARGFTELVYSVGVAAMVLIGGYLILDGVISLGRMISFFVVVGFLYPSFKSLSKVFNQIQECLAGTNRVYQLFDTIAEVKDPDGASSLGPPEQTIAFEAVSFSYDSEPVLRGVSFEAPVGKVIALVGPSGAGKSTLLDLIARFYDPTEGRVLFDGADIREFTKESLLASIAVVTQEPFLFNTSIRENIRFGRPGATQEEIEEAARAADIHEFIRSLPEGYETIVGERGALLSGGQRQRLTIARAVLRNPSILLLDEATSSLDTESESQVQKALASLMVGRTTFVIAHRLSTVQDADLILVLDKGRIVEEGNHASLLAKKGVYSHLYRIQFAETPGPGGSESAGPDPASGSSGAPAS